MVWLAFIFTGVLLATAGCGYRVDVVVPLGPGIIYYTSNSSSHVAGRVLAPDGLPIESARVNLHFEGYTWVGDHYEYVSFSQLDSTDPWGYFEIYVPAWAASDYMNMDDPAFHLHISAGPDFDVREEYFYRSIGGDPYLGTFVLNWGS